MQLPLSATEKKHHKWRREWGVQRAAGSGVCSREKETSHRALVLDRRTSPSTILWSGNEFVRWPQWFCVVSDWAPACCHTLSGGFTRKGRRNMTPLPRENIPFSYTSVLKSLSFSALFCGLDTFFFLFGVTSQVFQLIGLVWSEVMSFWSEGLSKLRINQVKSKINILVTRIWPDWVVSPDLDLPDFLPSNLVVYQTKMEVQNLLLKRENLSVEN